MKKLTLLAILFGIILSCKAQKEYPLNTFPQNIPSGSYIKDIENKLNPYIGTYKSNFLGNEITLEITKVLKRNFEMGSNFRFYKDALLIRYMVKNRKGQILQNTIGSNDFNSNTIFDVSYNSKLNAFSFFYSGTNCGVGYGNILIKKINNSTIEWTYNAYSTTLTSETCPENTDLNIYLPQEKNLVFIKQ